MATAAPSGIDNLQNLLNLYSSARGTSNTVTSGSNISDAGTNQILQQILGGTNGLAAISSGQKSAGAYNSSTNQLLTNDLLSRTAGEVAKLKAGTTTTTKTAGKLSGSDLLTMAGLAAGKSLLGPTISGIGKKFNVDDLGKTLADTLGVGASSPDVATAGSNLFTSANSSDFVGNTLSSLSDFGASLGSGAAADAATSTGVASLDEAVTNTAADTGSNIFSNWFGG